MSRITLVFCKILDDYFKEGQADMEEAFYKIIFDTIKEPVAIADRKRIIDCNKAFLDLLKLDRQKSEQELSQYYPAIAAALGQTDNCEVQLTDAAGDSFSLTLHCSSIDPTANVYLLEFRTGQNDIRYQEMTLLAGHIRELFTQFPDAIVILDNDDRIVDANPGFEALFGYTRKEYLGQDIDSLIVPIPERLQAKKLIHDVHRHKRLQIQLKRLTKAGRLIDVQAIAYTVMIDHKTAGNYVIYKDIQEQKETERRLLEKEAFFEQLFNNSLFPIAILDQEEMILDANKKFIEFFGYKKPALLGQNINKLIVPSQCADESRLFLDKILKKDSMSSKTVRKNALGELLEVEAVGSPVIINNTVHGMFAMYRDIRIEEQAIRELKTEKAYFQQLFDNTPSAVVLTDQNDRIKQVNRPFELLFGYTRQELLGGDLNDLIVNDTQRTEALGYSRAVTNKGQCIETEAIRTRKDGAPVEVSIIAFPIMLEKNHLGAYVIYMDISERRKKEREIERLLYTDPLTCLYNRKYAYEKLATLLKALQAEAADNPNTSSLTVIYIDMDRFKEINDEQGHQAGDEVLKAFAAHMMQEWSNSMDICRVGGDEFMCIISTNEQNQLVLQSASEWSRAIGTSFETPIKIGSTSTKIQLSLGWAAWPQDGTTVDQLVSVADDRMYTNKKIRRISSNPIRRQLSLDEIGSPE